MSYKISFALLLFAFTFANAQESTHAKTSVLLPGTPCELTAEDYAVFGGLLAGIGRPEDPEEAWHGKEFLIEDTTAMPEDTDAGRAKWGFRSKSKAAPAKDTAADLKTKVHDHCPVSSGFGDPNYYKIVSSHEIDEFFKQGVGGGWTSFYKKYPNAAGFWQFSRPGYDSAHDEAVLYVSHSCGGLCGTGHLYLLAKENGQWVVKNRVMLWIS